MVLLSSLVEKKVNNLPFFYNQKSPFIFLLKELIITSGGENVAPVPIEDAIKSEIPFVSNAMLIGDQRNFLSCLLTLKVYVVLVHV